MFVKLRFSTINPSMYNMYTVLERTIAQSVVIKSDATIVEMKKKIVNYYSTVAVPTVPILCARDGLFILFFHVAQTPSYAI